MEFYHNFIVDLPLSVNWLMWSMTVAAGAVAVLCLSVCLLVLSRTFFNQRQTQSNRTPSSFPTPASGCCSRCDGRICCPSVCDYAAVEREDVIEDLPLKFPCEYVNCPRSETTTRG